MLNSKTIGNKIATARKKTNLSQAELAQQVSISSQAVGKWERGESMPDITTLNRLAEIFGVDLNYFSDSFKADEISTTTNEQFDNQTVEIPEAKAKNKFDWSWDMSKGNWVDADFSGLKNLKEKFSSSNMKNCKFANADLSGLILGSNNIEMCDFSSSDIRNSKIQSSNLLNNQFNNCLLIDATFLKSNIGKCDFSETNFSGAEFTGVNFESNVVKNAVWKFTSFKNAGISDIVFEGTLENCQFENCTFYNVTFQNATILNTFFKYNGKFKRVQFIDCKVDKITYAFLKNNQANLTGITIIE
ncbi:MAG: pentapeptide repeat-containing protein [Bacteroidota bacterium]